MSNSAPAPKNAPEFPFAKMASARAARAHVAALVKARADPRPPPAPESVPALSRERLRSGTGVSPVGVGQASPPVQSTARLVEALRSALSQVVGTYGIILMHADAPGVIIGARRGSPLVLGVGSGENFFASDVSAIVAHTREAVYLKDFDIAVLGADDFEITSLLGGASGYEVSKVEFSAEDVSKGSYAHYMLKEIHEQPETIRDAMRGRLVREEATAKLGGLGMTPQQLREVDRIILTGCGTASHAAMCGEYIIEVSRTSPSKSSSPASTSSHRLRKYPCFWRERPQARNSSKLAASTRAGSGSLPANASNLRHIDAAAATLTCWPTMVRIKVA